MWHNPEERIASVMRGDKSFLYLRSGQIIFYEPFFPFSSPREEGAGALFAQLSLVSRMHSDVAPRVKTWECVLLWVRMSSREYFDRSQHQHRFVRFLGEQSEQRRSSIPSQWASRFTSKASVFIHNSLHQWPPNSSTWCNMGNLQFHYQGFFIFIQDRPCSMENTCFDAYRI